jgi:hypothetical protein
MIGYIWLHICIFNKNSNRMMNLINNDIIFSMGMGWKDIRDGMMG